MAGRTCTICAHAERSAIDAAIVAGGTLRDIARRFGVSKDAVSRHGGEHLPAALVQAQAANEVAQADDLLSLARMLQAEALDILARAKAQGDLRTALAAIGQARDNLLLFARLEALQAMPQTIITEAYPSAWVDAFDAINASTDDASGLAEMTHSQPKPEMPAPVDWEERERQYKAQEELAKQRQRQEHAERLRVFVTESETTDNLWISDEIA